MPDMNVNTETQQEYFGIMTKEELEKEATEYAQKLGVKDFIAKPKEIVAYFGYLAGAEFGYNKATEELNKLREEVLYANTHCLYSDCETVKRLKAQIDKLIDFVLSKTECCDVCPITDTCTNSEGTCPYVGILAKGEEEVTREWILKSITKG